MWDAVTTEMLWVSWLKLTAFSGLFFGAGVWGLWGLAKPLGWIMSHSYQPRSCLDVSCHLARGTWRFCGISMRRKCKRCCEYLWIIAWVSFKLTFIWCSQSLTVYRTTVLECLPHSWNSWFVGSWSKVVPGAGRAERSDSRTGALVCINSLALLKDTLSWLEPERHRTRYWTSIGTLRVFMLKLNVGVEPAGFSWQPLLGATSFHLFVLPFPLWFFSVPLVSRWICFWTSLWILGCPFLDWLSALPASRFTLA